MTAIVTIVIFLIMVSIHEFGHFIVAKKSGMTVTEFAVGMGPAILKKEKNGTLYSVRILPLGGYCRIEDDLTEDEKAFIHPLWKRFLMVLAGPVLNIVLGFILILCLVASSGEITTPVVDEFSKGALMENSGVQKGDRIVKINDTRISFYSDMSFVSQDFEENTPIKVTVKRDGEKIDFDIMPTKNVIKYLYKDDGVSIINKVGEHTEERFVPYSDTMLKDDSLVGTEQSSERWILGFIPRPEKLTPLNVLHESYCYTGFVVKLVYKSFIMLVTGKVSMDNVSGPVGIVQQVNEAVKNGYRYILNLTSLLTINLGVFNLLPIPALDGGRIVFMAVEFIRRKPVPPEKEGMVHMIGMILLLAFSVFISYKDIVKLIKK